jgi:hypothetical protein
MANFFTSLPIVRPYAKSLLVDVPRFAGPNRLIAVYLPLPQISLALPPDVLAII